MSTTTPVPVWARPPEFGAIAVFAALYAMGMAALFLAIDLPLPEAAVARAYVGANAVFACLTAEAVWKIQPWAYRAAQCLFCSCVGPILLVGLAAGFQGFLLAAVVAAFIAFPTVPMMGSIRDRTRALGLIP